MMTSCTPLSRGVFPEVTGVTYTHPLFNQGEGIAMGIIRKTMSVSTLGAVDFRSDKERTAAYAKATKKQAKAQTKLLKQQAKIQKKLGR
jgi:hypothetical protein